MNNVHKNNMFQIQGQIYVYIYIQHTREHLFYYLKQGFRKATSLKFKLIISLDSRLNQVKSEYNQFYVEWWECKSSDIQVSISKHSSYKWINQLIIKIKLTYNQN